MTVFDKAWGVVKAQEGVEEVRDLVQRGMGVMPAVREVARLLGLEGSELMRAYVEAYRLAEPFAGGLGLTDRVGITDD